MRKRKEKKAPQRQYLQSRTNSMVLDYRVYVLSLRERVGYFLLAFVAGAAVGYVFYGGLFLRDGLPTAATRISDLVVCCGAGTLAGLLFLPIRTRQLLQKRQSVLRDQFRALLSSQASSLSSGKNVRDAFLSVRDDLLLQYAEGAYILEEVDEILTGLQNNIPIEALLADFAQRTGNTDIINFSSVFEVCYRRGGSLKDVVRRTYEVISEKMACTDEIETRLASNRAQLNIMSVMPIAIIALLRFTNQGFAQNFSQPAGVAAITVGIAIFLFSYRLGQKIIQVKE